MNRHKLPEKNRRIEITFQISNDMEKLFENKSLHSVRELPDIPSLVAGEIEWIPESWHVRLA